MKWFSHGILGINARNLIYIHWENSAASISLADSKLKTKAFLARHGIPFARTYAVIRNAEKLRDFQIESIDAPSFVIKPNKGSGGRGILIVTKQEKDSYLINGESWSQEDLYLHMTDILHGSYSLYGSSDSVVVEEVLKPGREFAPYCQYGLADIRIIVYNYIPVAAIIRMPTAHSGGKANLAQWGIGLGLNIPDGKVTHLGSNGRVYRQNFPEEYAFLEERYLPHWDDILLLSSQVQKHTALGYLALDWVVTSDGPKLLEINARAGLEIQNISLMPLRSRLKKVEDLKIPSPEKGVEIAKSLFQRDTAFPDAQKVHLYLEQVGSIDQQKVTVRVDTHRNTSLISANLLWSTGAWQTILELGSWRRLTLTSPDISTENNHLIILGLRDIQKCVIRPMHAPIGQLSALSYSDTLHNIDAQMYRLSRHLQLWSLLKPLNQREERALFLQQTNYQPHFTYTSWSDARDGLLRDDIERLRGHIAHLDDEEVLKSLYQEKVYELADKHALIRAYQSEDFQSVHEVSKRLFGETDQLLLALSEEKSPTFDLSNETKDSLLGNRLLLADIIARIRKACTQYGLQVPIIIDDTSLARVSITYGKNTYIKVGKHAVIREKEIDSIIAHEIGVHLLRCHNGQRTRLKLFSHGSGYYLADEEWLAVYMSLLQQVDGYEKSGMYMKYLVSHMGASASFAETAAYITSLRPSMSREQVFSETLRCKRGIRNTSLSGCQWLSYRKDSIYLSGYMRVCQYLEHGGSTTDLMIGKIKISDISRLRFLF